jgi:hypothetical protein
VIPNASQGRFSNRSLAGIATPRASTASTIASIVDGAATTGIYP